MWDIFILVYRLVVNDWFSKMRLFFVLFLAGLFKPVDPDTD